MKNCKTPCRQLNFVFNNRTFNVNLDKLCHILKKLNIKNPNLESTLECKNFLKKNHLLMEEFLEFISY